MPQTEAAAGTRHARGKDPRPRTSREANGSAVPSAAPALTGLAVVDVGVTVAASKAGSAGAAVAPVGVLARGPIAAGALHTLVDVNLTGLTWGSKRDGDRGLEVLVKAPATMIMSWAPEWEPSQQATLAKGVGDGPVPSSWLSHGAGQDPPQGWAQCRAAPAWQGMQAAPAHSPWPHSLPLVFCSPKSGVR